MTIRIAAHAIRAGEGDAFKTNERFKYLSKHSDAKRLSTAFDSVTLYGFDPGYRPDIYGQVGRSVAFRQVFRRALAAVWADGARRTVQGYLDDAG